ncbi:hypothetical protein E2C01_001019 [Portunus trituberculatus]|uniref:Uncharacterized protein n=1 Tax=Portunus trituberculatus TaxID=210409 RepID=A0A5B7CFM8_PORTR|nr:hypothetical protein [Portunus trituberculatus]
MEETERLTSLSKISDWGKENFLVFNGSKTQFLHLSTRHNLPDNYPLFFSDTQLSPSSTLNILGLSFNCNLNWKLHISSLPKTPSPVFLAPPTANSVQGPYPSLNEVLFACLWGVPITQFY